MTFTVKHRRDDGTYVIDKGGLPYHVTRDDPLFASVDALAAGAILEPEPPPPQIVPAPPVEAVHVAWLSAALAEAGKLAAVEAAVKAAGPVAEALWQRAITIRIDDADVVAIASALNLDLRALFDRAEALRIERRGP